MTGASDADLVARLRGGDDAAAAELLRRHRAWLLARARRLCAGDEGAAEDLVQDFFVRLLRTETPFAGVGGAAFRTWAYSTLRRLRLTSLRDGAKAREAEVLVGDFAEWERALGLAAPAGAQPEAALLARAAVVDRLAGLGPLERECARRCYVVGESIEDVQRALGLSRRQVCWRLARVRAFFGGKPGRGRRRGS